jgi:hypothetical protein
MVESGLAAKTATASAAGKAAASATRVAQAVAQAVNKGIHGKSAKKVKGAAETSGAISTLLDFINGISESLDRLNAMTVPQLAKGWQAKVKSIVKTATALATLIAKEINKAFPWTKGKAKTKNKEAVDPKMGAKGQKVSHAGEMSGPIGELVSFISSISEALAAVVTVTVPAVTADVKANV